MISTMSTILQEISIADWIKVWHLLGPDEETLEQITSLLGFELTKEVIDDTETPKPLPKTETLKGRPWESEPPVPERPRPAAESSSNISMKVIEDNLPIEVSILKLPEPIRDKYEKEDIILEHYPLLTPIWTRAIITKLLSTKAEEGTPDIELLVKFISRNQLIKRIPYKALPTLRRGAQVLIDAGPGLLPYIRDQIFLIEQLRPIVGAGQVDVWTFTGTPLKQAISYSKPITNHYVPPSPGTPVLLLTDFGIAVPPFEDEMASIDEWILFVQYMRDTGCPLLALTPYNAKRWPKELKDKIKIVQWDRGTTVLTLLRSLNKSQG